MTAPDTIRQLVEHFDQNHESFRSGKYNEAQLRQEFLNPFFEALGWDMFNKQGYAEAYKDVIHEASLDVEGATKAPDYAFRIGGTRKFFVEAKKPAVNIQYDIYPAFQVRRYAWSAKLPLCILTDFEEFAVYDCRSKPNRDDKAATGRVMFLKYGQYVEKWDEIAAIFSHDAVMKGSFDKYAQGVKGKRGTLEVDDAFLEEIERWRNLLARNLALRNKDLNVHELNYSVQVTINRILFLRICEDRGIEREGLLQELLEAEHVYERMCQIFRLADSRYNSGLFHFVEEKGQSSNPDDLTLQLEIDDKVLKDIIGGLYYPSPYVFREIPADILGQVYERFLGKIIRLTAGHQAKVEEKPEVRKAGGVYYTPTYIVDYIVQNTVGKLLEGKTPKEAVSLKILDPACGSGSFLIGAYQYLLDWHLKWHGEHHPEKLAKVKAPVIYQVGSAEWRLTTAEKKRILLNNIHGVDIDPQAVEVTKLSLLLKVLEGESQESIGTQLGLFKERALPDLGRNIQCGNSLIGPDYYKDRQLTMGFADEEERQRVNAFNWQAAFPQIFNVGGFDIVIGNPPWGADFSEDELSYLRQKNKSIIVRMIDSFMYFVYKGCNIIKPDGYFGMILPDVVLYQGDNTKLREYILESFRIDSILNMGDVFDKVTRPSSIIILQNGEVSKAINIIDVSKERKFKKPTVILDDKKYFHLPQDKIYQIPNLLFVTSDPGYYKVWSKVNSVQHKNLIDLVDQDGIQRGVSPDLKKAFIVNSTVAKKFKIENNKLKRVLTGGKQVKRYFIDYQDLWLIYTSNKENFSELPNIRTYIDQFKSEIKCKEVKEKKHSIYALHRARKESIFTKQEKILGVITEDEIVVSIDRTKVFATDGLYLFGVRDSVNAKYVVAVLNSKLMKFVYRLLTFEEGRVLAQVKPTILKQLPIYAINFYNPADKTYHDQMVALVDRMLALHKQSARTPQAKEALQREIEATDKQINQLVYELYGLAEEEIKIVEGGGK